jgi:hypothetical protein
VTFQAGRYLQIEEDLMIKNALVAGAAVLLLTAPTFAATSYYIAQKPSGTSCSVVSAKPDGKTMMMMGKNSYKTNAAAEAAIKQMKACK